VWSLASPSDFDWTITRNIKTAEELDAEFNPAPEAATTLDEKSEDKDVPVVLRSVAPSISSQESYTQTEEFQGLVKAFRFAAIAATSLVVCFIIVSFLLSLLNLARTPALVLQLGHLRRQRLVCLGLHWNVRIRLASADKSAWIFAGCIAVVIYPVYESWEGISHVFSGMIKDVFGRRPTKASPSEEEL
jgi:hypothetical protein